jgi:ankyrin repeat protein
MYVLPLYLFLNKSGQRLLVTLCVGYIETDVLSTCRQQSPLHCAAEKGLVDIMELLVKHGAKVHTSSPWLGPSEL